MKASQHHHQHPLHPLQQLQRQQQQPASAATRTASAKAPTTAPAGPRRPAESPFLRSSSSASNLPKLKHHRRTHSASAAFAPRKPAPPTAVGPQVPSTSAPRERDRDRDRDRERDRDRGRDGTSSKSRLPLSSKHHHDKGLSSTLGGEDGRAGRGLALSTPGIRQGAHSSVQAAHSAELLSPRHNNMKKSTPDAKNLTWQKKGGAGVATGPGAGGGSSGGTLSPQVNKRVVGAGQEASSSAHSSSGTSGSSSSSKLRHAATCEANLSVTMSQQDTSHTTEDPEMFDSSATMASNGGSSSDVGADDFDSADGTGQDPTRTKAALDHISKKINCTMDQIKEEQNLKEDNVNEYLRLSANADRQQQQRIKTVFEKRNQKSTQSIAQLQRKLEVYQKRHREVETYGVSGHKQAKEVLRDVGHGLKGVVDNIRGAKETIVSKPKEFAHLIKNRFGSADNIPNLKYEEGQTEGESDVNIRHHGSGTLPPNSYKFPSDDDASSVRSSGSGPSAGAHSSPHPTLPHGVAPPSSAIMNQFYATRESSSAPTPTTDLEATQQILTELFVVKEMNVKLQDTIETMRSQMLDDCRQLKQAIEEERYRSERLEEQINDQTELHQHEVTNIKQELSSMEEKMEYQLEERTRDMQELLDTCRTSITKMELQQQQQQLISMEGIENSNFRALLTKMINVVLAILAVVLVFVSTVANLLGPFLTTRVRILSTIALIAAIVLAWQNWHLAEDFGQYLIEKYRRFVPTQ